MKKTPTFNVDLLCFPFFLNVKKKKLYMNAVLSLRFRILLDTDIDKHVI